MYSIYRARALTVNTNPKQWHSVVTITSGVIYVQLFTRSTENTLTVTPERPTNYWRFILLRVLYVKVRYTGDEWISFLQKRASIYQLHCAYVHHLCNLPKSLSTADQQRLQPFIESKYMQLEVDNLWVAKLDKLF